MRGATVFRRPAGPGTAVILAALIAAMGAPPRASAQERFRRTPPLPDAQRLEIKLPAVETFVLPNGLTVAAARRPESRMITLQLVVRAGEGDSPADRPGLASVTARMMGRGTKMLSADYLENMIESLGSSLKTTIFMDYTVLSLDIPDDTPSLLDRAILFLRMIAVEAAFSERELAGVRRAAYWQLYESKKNPEILGWRQLLRVLFEAHPYRVVTYNEDVIKYISTRDVADFYGRFYRPDNAAVLVSGNIDGAVVAQKIGSHFAGWAVRGPEAPTPPPPPQNDRDRVCFVADPDSTSATIFAGNVIMGSQSQDFFPVLVLKQILGGTTRNRLFMNLRETKNYATYAFSEMEVYGSCGVYWARAQVRPEALAPAINEILGEISALASGPAVPSEIEEAKSYLVGNLPLRFESPAGFADWMARYVALGLDPGQWDRGAEELKLVNAERVREAAKKYLAAKPVVIVVGRPEWVGLHLGELNAVEVYDTAGQLMHTVRKGEGR